MGTSRLRDFGKFENSLRKSRSVVNEMRDNCKVLVVANVEKRASYLVATRTISVGLTISSGSSKFRGLYRDMLLLLLF